MIRRCVHYIASVNGNLFLNPFKKKEPKFIYLFVFQIQTALFNSTLNLKFKKETRKVPHLECSCVECWNLETSERRSEIPWKFWNVVLEKDGKDQLDRSCEKWKRITYSKGGKKYPPKTKKRRKANCNCHILRKNRLLKHFIEGRIEGMMEVWEDGN